MKAFVLAAATLLLLAAPSLAQTPAASGGNCLFPLACPGPVPPKPEPLLGSPEDETPAAQPVEAAAKPKHHGHKRAKLRAQ